jgi:hypothetical protein
MPTTANPGTNRFRCESCGRHFDTEGELKSHQVECAAAKAGGAAGTGTNRPAREEGEDREWVSTP